MAFDIASVLKDVSGADTGRDQIEYIDLDLLDPDPNNFYLLDGLDELAGNIELIGLQQPLRVRRSETRGRYVIVSGHRRKAACMMIRDGGSDQFKDGVPCIVERGEESDALRELRLIYANAATRVMTSAEISRQAERVTELLYQLKEEGVDFPGRMRDHVAEACRVSKTKLARLHAIRKNLAPDLLTYYDRGDLSEECAYQLSRLPADIQKAAVERLADGRQKKIPTASVVEEVNRGLKRYLAEMSCMAHAGGPDCHWKNEKILRSLFVPYSWQVCPSGTCCRNCHKSKDCSRACQECKDRRKLEKSAEAEREAAIKKETEATQERYRAQRKKQAQRVLKLAEAAGVTEAELPRKWAYEKPYSLKQIRKFAAGDFGDDHYYDGDLIPDQIGAVKLWAKELMCSVDELLGLSVPAPKTAEPVSGSDTGKAPELKWQTGTPAEAGDYAILCGGPDKLRFGSYTKAIKRWDGEHWTNGQGVPLRLNVYGWVRLPEVDV